MMMKKYDDIENKLEYIVNIMEEFGAKVNI